MSATATGRRVAVLGLGSIGQRHSRNLEALGHSVVGFDPLGPPEGFEGEFTDSQEVAISGAEAVVVASPNSLHASQALAAIEAGKPTLVEKPMTTSRTDAEEVLAAAEGRGVALAVGMNMRFLPALVQLKELIDSGRLGRPLLATAWMGHALPKWRPQVDYRASYSARSDLHGGVLWDAIHEIDYIGWLLGPATRVQATTAKVSDLEIDVEDLAMLQLSHQSGAMASLVLNFFEAAYRRGCVISGTEATAEWDLLAEEIVVRRDEERETIDVSADYSQTYVELMANFIEAATGEGEARADGSAGCLATATAEAAHRAARSGARETVEVPA